jgi:transposase
VFAKGVAKFRQGLQEWLGEETGLSAMAHQTLRELLEQFDQQDKRIDAYDKRVAQAAKEAPRAQRLMQIPGIGQLTATAILSSVADAHHFDSGRDLSANLGIVPRQHSSGGKERLLGITKRGDSYLRTLLIHGARSALRTAGNKQDRVLRWAFKLQERRGAKVAAVALANKMARIAWALLAHDRDYAANYAQG